MAVLSGIREIDTKTYRRLVRDAIINGRNLLVLAPAGSGKTEIALDTISRTLYPGANVGVDIEEHPELATYYDNRYLNLSVCTPPELVGLPEIKDGVSVYAPPEYMPVEGRTEGNRKVVMVVDELDKADTDLQNPMLETFQFRSINGTKLAVQSIIATANMPDEGAFSKPISTALANRCQIFKLKVNPDQWIEYASTRGLNPLVAGYIAENPADLTKRYNVADNTAYCQPSPRSWTNAAIALDTVGEIRNEDDIEYAHLQVASYVGDNAAQGFRMFLEYSHKVSPLVADILAGRKLKKEDIQPSMVLVLSLMVCGKLTSKVNANMAAMKEKKDIYKEYAAMAKNVFTFFQSGAVPMETILAALRSTASPQFFTDSGLIAVSEVREVYTKIASKAKAS